MAWLLFAISTAFIVAAASRLAMYGDAISLRTSLGAGLVGVLLMAGATSLPEVLTMISSLLQGEPNLAAGNLFGSNMVNMLLLGVMSLLFWRVGLMRQVALRHAVTASVALLLTIMAAFFLLADIDLRVGWVGVDSLLLVIAYLVGMRLIRRNQLGAALPEQAELDESDLPTLPHAVVGFAVATLVLIVATPVMVNNAVIIAEQTGLGTSFVGVTLVGLVTSLPEFVAVLAAARIGAYDIAVGNLFGSNVFNMLVVGLTDFVYVQGRFLGAIDPSFAVVALLGLLLTCLALIGDLSRSERRVLAVDIDAVLIVVVYALGLWFLYMRGISV